MLRHLTRFCGTICKDMGGVTMNTLSETDKNGKQFRMVKNPIFWMIVLVVIACVAVTVYYLMNQKPSRRYPVYDTMRFDVDGDGNIYLSEDGQDIRTYVSGCLTGNRRMHTNPECENRILSLRWVMFWRPSGQCGYRCPEL